MLFRFIVSLLFALVLNLQSLFEWVWWGAMSPRMLSDWDEQIYFPWMHRYAKEMVLAFSANDWHGLINQIETLISGLPHFLIGAILFLPAAVIDIPLTVIGLVSDLFFSFLSFFLLSLNFEILSKSRSVGILTALIALCFPYVLRWLPDLGPNIEYLRLVSVVHSGFPSIPVLRGPFTQLSYPFFIGTILIVVQRLGISRLTIFWSALAGLLAGLSIYVYFFAWLTLVILIPLLLVIHQQDGLKAALFKQAIPFIIAASVIAGPAVYGILVGFVENSDPYRIEIPLRGFYFSFADILLLLVLKFLGKSFPNRLVWCLILALYFTKLFAMNLQGILNKWLLPYHVPLFYTDPLLIGLSVILLFSKVTGAEWRSRVLRFTLIPWAAAQIGIVYIGGIPNEQKDLEAQLFQAVIDIIPVDATIAVYSFAITKPKTTGDLFYRLTFPGVIENITNRRILFEIPERTPYGRIERELLTSWIFLGKVDLLVPADSEPPPLSGDLIRGVFDQYRYERYEVLRRFGSEISSLQLCDLLRIHKFEFVYFNSDKSPVPKESLAKREFFTLLWSSANEKHHIFKFDYGAAINETCLQSAL